jgi:hypothetical protein
LVTTQSTRVGPAEFPGAAPAPGDEPAPAYPTALTDIRRQLDQLQDELEGKPDTWDLEQLGSDLRQRLRDLEHKVDAQVESLDDLDRDLRGELDEAIAELARRLQFHERVIRAADGVTTPDLDPDRDTIGLARRAARGRWLEEQLLSPLSARHTPF